MILGRNFKGKILCLLLAVLMLGAIPLEGNATTAGEEYAYGDVNGEGEITVSDAILVLRDIVGLQDMDPDQKYRADVEGNGEIAVGDAILILRMIVGLINQFPVEIWDPELLFQEDKWDEISNLALSPDGDTVVVESELYSLEERKVFASKTGEDAIEMGSVDFSPDGSILASAWWGVDLYDAEDLTHIKNIQDGHESRVKFSPDGEMLATQRHGEAWLWERTNEVEFEEVAEFAPEAGLICAIEFSPGSDYLAAGFDDGKVRLWDTKNYEVAKTFDLESEGWNHNLAFSPDGETLAATEPDLGSELHLFDLENGSRKHVLDISRIFYEGVLEFSPDGRKLAYGSSNGEVEILDTEDWSQLYLFEHDDSICGLSFSPDSRTMVVGSRAGTLYLYQD